MLIATRHILLFLAYCQLIYSVRRHHHRRSISYDKRYLGFKWLAEPTAGVFESIDLPCQFRLENDAVSDLRVEWKKDGSVLSGQHVTSPNSSFSVLSPSSSDEGFYQCVVHVTTPDTTTWTFVSRRAKVRLPSLPRFESQPGDRIAAPGMATVFHCYVNSHPPPSVKWYHNDKLITSGGDYSILPVSNSLEIHRVFPKHAGVYKCVVEGGGKSRTSQTARLKVDASADPSDLSVLSSPRALSVTEGEETLLECLVYGVNGKGVEWVKDGSILVEDGGRVRRVGVSSLFFSRVLSSDSGTYACRASKDGDTVDKVAVLHVKVPPTLTTLPADRIALETTDVELECSASGRPGPSIQWLKNGEALVPSEYFVVEANKLKILGLVKTDQGVYQCIAENDAGIVHTFAQLLVESADSSSVAASSGRPLLTSAPLGLRSSVIGARSISLEWDAPLERHGNILNYHVFYREEGSDRERSSNSTTLSLSLSSLQPDTLYIIRVAAENVAGVGTSSDHIKVTTKREQAVPGRVSALSTVPIGAETIEVRWEPPPADGPHAVRYRLFYIRNPPEKDEKETQITVSSTAYTLHGMDKFTEYGIRVEAEGDNGAGLSSDTIYVRTLSDLPSAPPRDISAEAQSSTSIRVNWQQPEASTVHGELSGYRLKYKTKLRGGKVNTIVIDDVNQMEHVIDGLEPSGQYSIRMAVVNQNGTGQFSDWIRADTPAMDKEEKLLGAPVELKPIPGPDYIIVTWKPPSDETTIVRSYQIGWGNNVPDVEHASVAANTYQYRITGLQPGREYVISVRAKNKVGLGYPIYETLRTSSSSRPIGFDSLPSHMESMETPIGVRAESLSASSMRVMWADPDEEAFNTHYTVRYSTSADGNKLHFVNSSDRFVVVDSLRPATEYEFAVRAMRPEGGGVSTWSMAARNRTSPSPPSSPPRDVTLSSAPSGDPHQVVINWQPPKYANGELIEYLIYYSDRASPIEKDWRISYVPADRLSHSVHDLLPKATYYFKIQARNEMGYGPMSSVAQWRGSAGTSPSLMGPPTKKAGEGLQLKNLVEWLTANPFYLAVAVAFSLLVLIAVVMITICVIRHSSKNKPNNNAPYGMGKHNHGQPGDLWINHPGGSHVRGMGTMSDIAPEGVGCSLSDMKHLGGGSEVVDSPPPRYQAALQGDPNNPYGCIMPSSARPHLRQSISSAYDDRSAGADSRRPLIGRAKPMPTGAATNYAPSEADSGGTISRSYHHSSTSLENRQRTPQVVYTGNGRHQPIARVDLCDSPYGSSSQLAPPTPPLPMQAPPPAPIHDGYRTLRGQPPGSGQGNPLRSFTSLSAVPPPSAHPTNTRPMVIAAGGKQLPVGRATAQPRVNVANIYSPYASCSQISSEDEKKMVQQQQHHGEGDVHHHHEEVDERTPLQPSISTEELNAQMENLDTMIDDLQQMQHEFLPTN